MPVAKRKERKFRLPDNFSFSYYTDDELRSRYRFGGESITFLVDLLRHDLERSTSRNHAWSCIVANRASSRCGYAFLRPVAFFKSLGIFLAYQSRPSYLLSLQTSPLPLYRDKDSSSSSHQRRQRFSKQSEGFTTREGSLGLSAV